MQVASQITVTVLCDNWARGKLLGEHGLALWIEVDGTCILFDMGAGRTLFYNARHLDIDLARADCIVISHGHYDHTGGLAHYLKKYGPKDVYLPESAFVTRYAPDEDRLIGIPHGRTHYQKLGARWCPAGPVSPGAQVITAGPRLPHPQSTKKRFTYLEGDGTARTDRFPDEQILVIQTQKGIILITGCTHTGLDHCLEKGLEAGTAPQLLALFGGLHLEKASAPLIDQVSHNLRSYRPRMVGACHCTGHRANARLAHMLPQAFVPASTGYTWSFPAGESGRDT